MREVAKSGKIAKPGKMHFLLFCGRSQNLEKLQNLEKCIFCWFPGRLQHYPTLSVLILDPRKNCKTWKNAFFTGSREGQNLEKLQNLEKCIFCCFAGGPQRYPKAFFAALREGFNAIQRYPSLSQTLEKLPNLEKCIFCWFPGRPQRYPSLSQTLEKLQNLEKCIFCWFAGVKTWENCKTWKNAFLAALREGPNAIQRYPSFSQTRPSKNCKTWKNAFFAGFREGFNAIQRYPPLSQTLEKLQNVDKSIFSCFAGGRKTWKNCKTWKNAFFVGFREDPNAIQRYPSLSQTRP